MTQLFKNFIGGEWIESTSGETFKSTNPADTGEVIAEYQKSNKKDVENAFEAANKAQPAWAAMEAPKRGSILIKAAEILEKRVEQIGKELVREEGKNLGEAKGETMRSVNLLRYFGGEGARFFGQVIPSERPGVFSYTFRKPLGVVSLITPWNFPIAIPVWKAAPALVSGNAVVLKPASLAPICVMRVAEVLDEAGLPRGIFNVITGSGSQVGDALIENKVIKAVSFTGSCEVGHTINDKATKKRIKTQMEMGGKNPTIVLKDADISKAVEIVINAAFFGTGQKCTATSRAIVEKPIYEKFIEALVERTKKLKIGNGLETGVDIGPCVDESQMNTVLEYIDIGKKEGGTIECGGNRLTDGEYAKGYFVEPTVFSGINNSMRIAQEEIFGPVVAVIPAEDFNEAIEIANNVKFGLSASIITNNLARTFDFLNSIESGLMMVNLPSAGVDFHVPFGGMKDSSFGMKEQGPVAIDFYTELKIVYIKTTM